MIRTVSVWWARVLPVALVSLLLSSCADDAPRGGDATPPPACDDGEDICTHLAAHSAISQVVYWNSSAVLKVRWTNRAGDPIPNGEIDWALVQDQGPTFNSRIGVASSRTNSDGVAEVTVFGGAQNARFSVEASAPSAPRVKFTVAVVSKDDGLLTVKVRYEGGIYGDERRAFDDTQVLVFRGGRGAVMETCQPQNFDPYNYETSLATIGALPALKSHEFPRLPGEYSFSGFRRGDVLTVVAFGRKHYPEGRVGLAWACESEPAVTTINPAQPAVVELNLADLHPRYSGVYEVTSYFDFLAMVPDNVERWIRDIGNLFRSPGDQIIEWLLQIDAVGDQLDSLPGAVTDLIKATLSTALDGLLEQYLPDSVQAVRNGTVDVFDILTNLEVKSELHFTKEPSEVASSPGLLAFPTCDLEAAAESSDPNVCAQRERWTALGFNWRNSSLCEGRNDEQCTGYREYSLEGFGVDVIGGHFNSSVYQFWNLTIEPHPLSLSWGDLIIFVFEKMVLPMIFGPSVDTLEDFIFALIGGQECALSRDPAEVCCENLVQNMGNTSGTVVKSICKTGVPLISSLLRSQLGGQDVDSGDGFVIGTSDAFVENQGEGGVAGTCANAFDDDGDGKEDCVDEDCALAVNCLQEMNTLPSGDVPAGACDNGIDDDRDRKVDCEDEDCEAAAVCQACRLYDDNPTDLTVDGLGKDPEPHCDWRARARIGSTEPDLIEADFYGVRRQ